MHTHFSGTLLSYICVLVRRWLQGRMCLQIHTSHLHLDGADVLSDGAYLHYAFTHFLVKSGLFEKEKVFRVKSRNALMETSSICCIHRIILSSFLVHQQSCLRLYLCFAAFFLLVSIGIISEFTNSRKTSHYQAAVAHAFIAACNDSVGKVHFLNEPL